MRPETEAPHAAAEADWARRWRDGDAAAFDRLYALASPRLLSFCRMLARDEGSAQDLFQETWRIAVQQAAQYRGERPFRAWLVSIARNHWIDRGRRGQREAQILDLKSHEARETLLPETQRALEIRDAMAHLPPEERDALLVYHFQELPLKDAADVLGITLAVLRTRLAKARENLARILKHP